MWGNKGMHLEELLAYTNKHLEEHDIALITKTNIDLKLVGIDNRLVTGVMNGAAVVDYIGLYKGGFVAFEAKQCSANSFSLRNIKKHQLDYLNKVDKLGGEAFVIIYFTKQDTYWKVYTNQFEDKKSLKYDWIVEECVELKIKHPMMLNYLLI